MRIARARLLVGLSLLLAACTTQPTTMPAPIATAPPPTTAPVPNALEATATPAATATSAPTTQPTVAPPTETTTPEPTAAATQHIVAAGDTLFNIALRYGVTVDALRAANNLFSDLIYVGQVLVIPSGGVVPTGAATQAPATQTAPTATPQAGAPVITALTLTQDTVGLDQPLTARWTTTGAVSVTVWMWSWTGTLLDPQVGLAPNSQVVDTVPGRFEGETHIHMIAFGADGRTAEQDAQLTLPCRFNYFFTSTKAFLCPRAPAETVSIAQQRFEHGWLLSDRGTIFALYDNGSVFAWGDAYKEGDPTPEPQTPPAGLYVPTRGFELFWRTLPGVRDGLGWATEPTPVVFDGLTQGFSTGQQMGRGFATFFRISDGRVVELMGNTVYSQWAFVP